MVVRAGQVLVLPPNVPHGALALEASLLLDNFSPIRQDWLDHTDSYLRQAATAG
jgi:quercetin dioxygenase-like cupin family protein